MQCTIHAELSKKAVNKVTSASLEIVYGITAKRETKVCIDKPLVKVKPRLCQCCESVNCMICFKSDSNNRVEFFEEPDS